MFPGRGGGMQRGGGQRLEDQRRQAGLVRALESVAAAAKNMNPGDVPAQEVVSVLEQLPIHLSPRLAFDDGLLLASQLLGDMLARLQVPLEPSTVEVLVSWLVGVAGGGFSRPQTLVAVLRAMSTLLLDYGPVLTKLYPELVGENGILLRLADGRREGTDLDTLRMAVNCIGNLCSRATGPKLEKYMGGMYGAVYQHLARNPTHYRAEGERSVSKLLSSSLRALQHVIGSSRKVHVAHMDSLVPTLCSFMFHGLPSAGPSPAALRHPNAGRSGAMKGAFRSEWTNDKVPTLRAISSDSEMSDVDGTEPKRRITASAVRLNALSCLQTSIRYTPRKDTYRFWAVVGLAQDSLNRRDTLMSAMLHDPDVRVRMGAMGTLAAFLDGSTAYLSAANDTADGRRTSFTTFSEALGITVRHLHEVLLAALANEITPQPIAMATKCLTVLVLSAPYARLQPNLLWSVMARVATLLQHPDATVSAAGLSCLGAVCCASAREGEVATLLKPPLSQFYHSPQEISGQNGTLLHELTSEPGMTSNTQEQNNLVNAAAVNDPANGSDVKNGRMGGLFDNRQSAIELLGGAIANLQLPEATRAEAFTALCCLARHHLPLFGEAWACGMGATVYGLLEGADGEKAAGLIEEYARWLHMAVAYGAGQKSDVANLELQANSLWAELLGGRLQGLFSSQSAAVRAAACTITSYMGHGVFARLRGPQQRMLVALPLGLSGDSSPVVRAGACRALGAMVLYPDLRQDVIFAQDMAGTVRANLSDEVLAVRVRACWALANLGDALVTAMNLENECVGVSSLKPTYVASILTSVDTCDKDNDKVRCNMVRCLGTYSRLLLVLLQRGGKASSSGMMSRDEPVNQSELFDVVQRAVGTLCAAARHGPVKVRWNACHGLGHILRASTNQVWVLPAIRCLTGILGDCKNFKVRINAATAISAVESRESLGESDTITEIVREIGDGLVSAEKACDLNEYRYRDTLVDHLCLTIGHIFSLCQPSDVTHNPTVYQSLASPLSDSLRNFALRKAAAQAQGDSEDEGPPVTAVNNTSLDRPNQAKSIAERLQALLKACGGEGGHGVVSTNDPLSVLMAELSVE